MTSVESKSSKRSRQSSIGQEIDLHVTNPELFKVSPRPGGFLKIRVPPRGEEYDYNLYNKPNEEESEDCHCSSDPNICLSINKANASAMLSPSKNGQAIKLPSLPVINPGREFRLKRAVESTDWTIKGIDETDTMIEISNPIQDTLNMLAVTISTIMMLSAQVPNIEDVYLDWATKYLNCIVDESNEEPCRPPNVQGILNHILMLKMGGKKGKVSGNDAPQPNISPKSSPPPNVKKGSENGGSIASGSAGGGSGTRGGSAGGAASGTRGGSTAGVGSTRSGGGSGIRQNYGKGVSIDENSSRRARLPDRHHPTPLAAIRSR